MAVDGDAGLFLLLGRLLFGLTLAFMGLNHFLNLEQMTGYAEFKGLPAPGFMTVASGVMLLLGGLGIAAGAYPVLSAGTLAVFNFVSAFTMHAFWSVPDDQQQDEMTQFLKNMVITGGALAFLAIGGQDWTYAVGASLF
ncbi:DoxX family membrane protein [Salarchaeum japonicum]|uniref:DoxX family membrane protein n=1 Tax=Salarchaeum japonicum TaxID=555573 RepID=UPI003C787BDA